MPKVRVPPRVRVPRIFKKVPKFRDLEGTQHTSRDLETPDGLKLAHIKRNKTGFLIKNLGFQNTQNIHLARGRRGRGVLTYIEVKKRLRLERLG